MRLKAIIPSAVMALAVSGTSVRAAEPLMRYVSPVKDITLTSKIVSRDMDALKKISPEFAQSYRFASSTVYYKEPNQMRLASKAGFINVTYVINGNQKFLKAGFMNKQWDITHTPGQRQSVMTVGLLTPSFVDLVNVTYKGSSKVDGRKVEIYEAHFKEEPRGTYFKLFMDPERKYTVRQEHIHGDGKLKVVYRFLKPVKVNGVWVPTSTEVINGDGQKGATTKIENIKVDTGLPDSLFRI